ncbi:hypothetical protein HAX54_000469 [Datura stramonium]|uniref:Pentatricopeptide repeat-containing protein n=1 Tax=Datura stramonium TaxID=4076 RepID=A0ABS8WS18_DATST|nr:hypothetical protein [Datura stramonium]
MGQLKKAEDSLKSVESRITSCDRIPYHYLISLYGTEKIYDKWIPIKMHYDPRIRNLLLGYYIRKGFVDKASAFFDQMIEARGKSNSMTCEILLEGHIKEWRISEALSYLKDGISTDGSKR